MPRRAREGSLPRRPSVEPRRADRRWAYLLVGGFTLLTGCLAVLVVTVGGKPAHTASTTAVHGAPHRSSG
ncbi:hypothetical protein [Micromonospora sp. NPDC006431]|uniref:hypothetical protein n=1 Tax=Micromonospora sp. NPDC006431 TaxID=3364235 RepID=UPI0036A35E01